MRRAITALATALLLIGCSAGNQDDDGTAPASTDTETEASSTDTETEASPSQPGSNLLPVVVTYDYKPGTRLDYRMEIDQRIDVEVDAPTGLPGSIPGHLNVEGETELIYRIGSGPQDDTFEIHLTADLTEMSYTGTFEDETLPGANLLGDEIPSVDLTVIVDEQGKILEYESLKIEGLGEVEGDLYASRLATDPLGLSDFELPIGPTLPDDRTLGIGDTWTDRTTDQIIDQTIVTDYTHQLTDITELDGVEVMVIETTATIDSFEIDLIELIKAIMAGIGDSTSYGDGAQGSGGLYSEDEMAELDSALGGLQMSMASEPTTLEMTTWMSYDPIADGRADGTVRQAIHRTSGAVTVEMLLPSDAPLTELYKTSSGSAMTVVMRFTNTGTTRFTLTNPDDL